uniref:Uncharacterized protein n=1 Tax=Oryza sativa subsp. japonica TaxID=39947 RepID=Q33B76_ORYSJ|nr:hypothetical protein LOC_Os10g04460 [Oryza sativa Japonica Group]
MGSRMLVFSTKFSRDVWNDPSCGYVAKKPEVMSQECCLAGDRHFSPAKPLNFMC